MEIRSLVIAILIVAVSILQSGEAKKCYSCDSRTSKTCVSGPLPSEVMECPLGLHCGTCNYRESNGTTTTIRRCDYMNLPSQSVDNGDCNLCNEELCNTANIITISMSALGCLVSFWAIRFVLTDSY